MAPLHGQNRRHRILPGRRHGSSPLPGDELAKDANIAPEGHGFNGVSLAYNTRNPPKWIPSKEAAAAGAKILKSAEEAFWGGISDTSLTQTDSLGSRMESIFP